MAKKKRKQLRWRREPRATGLAGVCQGTRGWELRYGGATIGTVSILRGLDGPRHSDGPWYWVTYSGYGVPWKNTSAEGRRIVTVDEAKAECRAFVKKHLVRDGL